MLLQKWNTIKREYEDYNVPDDWNVKSFTKDMEEIVNCASCGKKMIYGNSYTSLEIHTPHGFGYGVCDECYRKELKRKFGR